MGKQPAFQFYPGDYIQDTRCLSLAAKGAWVDLLCAMWRSQTRGELSLPMIGYARLIGASVDQTEAVINELIDMRICDSENNGDGKVKLISRRMVREERERSAAAKRQASFREKGGGNPDRWTAIRVPILIRDEYICAYCGRKADTVDHIIPKSKGGTEDPSNLVACCKRCNVQKNNRNLEQAGMSFWKGFDQNKLDNTLNNTEITPLSSSSSSSSNKKDKKYIERDPNVKVFIDFYFEEFKSSFGNPPIIDGGKDGTVVKKLLKHVPIDELKSLLLKFFKSEDKFIMKSGYSLGVFKSQVQKLRIHRKDQDGIDKATQLLKDAINQRQEIEYQP